MALSLTPTNTVLPVLKKPHEFHAFIAYCKDDLKFAKSLLKELEAHGLKCLFADRDFMAGQHITENIAEAIRKSRRVVIVISKSSSKSTWLSFEMMVSLEKTYEQNKLVMIPVLVDVEGSDLPQMLKSVTYIHKCEDGWMRKLLRDLSGPDVSVETMLPAGNVAHGLAWSYFYGYLKLLLPGLEKRIKRCATWQQNSKRMSKKLYILIPESCLCHPCLSDVDGNIRYQENLEELSMNRAGNHQRVYKNSIYQVTSDQVYYFIGEYATVVQAMYEMEMGRIAGLTSDEKKLQVIRFHKTLLSVLNHGHASECHGTFKLLFYCDNPKEDQYVKLSELIIQEIKADLGQSDLVAEVLDARDIVS